MEAIDLKAGMFFEYEGVLYEVIESFHTHQQQRRGLVRVKAKELKSGKIIEHVFRSDVKINHIIMEEVELLYLYRDGESYYFMDENTYEQIALPKEIVGENGKYLKENMKVTGLLYNGKVVDIKVPFFVDYKVIEAEPNFKGDTVQGGKKKAKVETGQTVQVPLFIKVGDIIRIDTRTGQYVTRVSENES